MVTNVALGGRPYDDLVKLFEYVEENLDYVDTDNAVAAGGSYGGYLANVSFISSTYH